MEIILLHFFNQHVSLALPYIICYRCRWVQSFLTQLEASVNLGTEISVLEIFKNCFSLWSPRNSLDIKYFVLIMLLCALNSYCSLAVCINLAAYLHSKMRLLGHHFLESSLYFSNMFLWLFSYCVALSIFKIEYSIFSFWNIILETEKSAWYFEAKTSNWKVVIII